MVIHIEWLKVKPIHTIREHTSIEAIGLVHINKNIVIKQLVDVAA